MQMLERMRLKTESVSQVTEQVGCDKEDSRRFTYSNLRSFLSTRSDLPAEQAASWPMQVLNLADNFKAVVTGCGRSKPSWVL